MKKFCISHRVFVVSALDKMKENPQAVLARFFFQPKWGVGKDQCNKSLPRGRRNHGEQIDTSALRFASFTFKKSKKEKNKSNIMDPLKDRAIRPSGSFFKNNPLVVFHIY